MRTKLTALIFAVLLCFFGVTAHAQADGETTVSSAVRTISTEGAGHVVDNITDTDGEKIQFITVTAKDGSVFYVVIDNQNSNDNVYFLNAVDVSDLEALAEDYTSKTAAAVSTLSPSPTPATQETAAESKTAESKTGGVNGSVILIILVIAAAVFGGGYYVKVILPKKKLEDADDLEDFDFDDEDENINDDTDAGTYDEETDDTEDEE